MQEIHKYFAKYSIIPMSFLQNSRDLNKSLHSIVCNRLMVKHLVKMRIFTQLSRFLKNSQ